MIQSRLGMERRFLDKTISVSLQRLVDAAMHSRALSKS